MAKTEDRIEGILEQSSQRLLGRSCSAMHRARTDLPDPAGPTTPNSEPAWTSTLTSRSAMTEFPLVAKVLDRFSTVITKAPENGVRAARSTRPQASSVLFGRCMKKRWTGSD